MCKSTRALGARPDTIDPPSYVICDVATTFFLDLSISLDLSRSLSFFLSLFACFALALSACRTLPLFAFAFAFDFAFAFASLSTLSLSFRIQTDDGIAPAAFDDYENVNLHGNPEFAEIEAQLLAQLKALVAMWRTPWPPAKIA